MNERTKAVIRWGCAVFFWLSNDSFCVCPERTSRQAGWWQETKERDEVHVVKLEIRWVLNYPLLRVFVVSKGYLKLTKKENQ